MKSIKIFTFLFLLSFIIAHTIGVQSTCAQSSSTFQQRMNSTQWKYKDGFKYPSFMTHYNEKFIDDVPASVEKWKSGSVELCYWPGIGSWATMESDYPVKGSYLSDNVLVKNITYRSGNGIYSGYASDGRIFYMKVNVACGESTCHAFSLIIMYPKQYQSAVSPMINVIKNWKLKLR